MEGGRWGIVIVISAFMIQFLIFGFTYTIPIYNVEFLKYFDASAAEISCIGSLNMGIFLGSGPIVSYLMTIFSYRKIALFGSVLVTLGLISVPILPYLYVMYVTVGIITGFGSCCAYIPSHALSGMYYDKYRSLATGVATSGSGLGGAVIPILSGVLIETYSWKGSFFIITGICFQSVIFAALLRDPPDINDHENAGSVCIVEDSNGCVDGTLALTQDVQTPQDYNDHCKRERKDTSRSDGSDVGMIEKLSWRPGAGFMSSHTSLNKEVGLSERNDDSGCETSRVKEKEEAMSISPRGVNSDQSLKNIENVESSLLDKKKSESPETSKHFYIFKNYNFDVYFINNVFWNQSVGAFIAFCPEYFRLQGLTLMEVAWVTGGYGFGCFVGGILGGVLGNLKWMNRIYLFSFANLGMGITYVVTPLGEGKIFYGSMLVFSGVFFGIVLGILVVVLTDLIGIESIGNGLGYLMLANGLGTFTGPLLAGALIDSTGKFEYPIYLAGLLSFFASVSMLLIPLRQRLCHIKSA